MPRADLRWPAQAGEDAHLPQRANLWGPEAAIDDAFGEHLLELCDAHPLVGQRHRFDDPTGQPGVVGRASVGRREHLEGARDQ